MSSYVLGMSCYYHDSAAALLKDGEIICAAQEERFSRKKHDSSFPKNAVFYCLKSQGISLSDIKEIVYYEKPLIISIFLMGALIVFTQGTVVAPFIYSTF